MELAMAAGEKRLRSNPGPSCQNRKQNFPGRSWTVSCWTSGELFSTSNSRICFDVGCFIHENPHNTSKHWQSQWHTKITSSLPTRRTAHNGTLSMHSARRRCSPESSQHMRSPWRASRLGPQSPCLPFIFTRECVLKNTGRQIDPTDHSTPPATLRPAYWQACLGQSS